MYITNMNYLGMKLSSQKLAEYITSKLLELNIEVTNEGVYSETIKLIHNADNRIFKSTVVNKIVMNPADPRIIKLGRNYLESTRLTKKQSDALINFFFVELPNNGILFDLSNGENAKYIENGTKIAIWPEPTNFPIEMTETV